MKKEEKTSDQRRLFQSQKSPRCHTNTCKNDENTLQIRKNYTRTVYNKYNRLLETLNSKTKNTFAKTYIPFDNYNSDDNHKFLMNSVATQKIQIRIRKMENKTKKGEESSAKQSHSSSIRFLDGSQRSPRVLSSLQNIYQISNITSYSRIMPRDISTNPSYYGIELPVKKFESVLQALKHDIKIGDSLQKVQQILRNPQFK